MNSFYQIVGSNELAINSSTLPSVDASSNRFSAGQGFGYDKNGNITTDPMSSGRTFVFNGDNKQVEVKNSSNATIGTYLYDGNGKRVKKVTDLETTIFVYDGMGKLIGEYSTATPPSNPTTNYTATDQLGSPRVLTNSVGEVVSRRDFMPFGEELFADSSNRTTARKYSTTDQDAVRQRFTGYQKDAETGLDFAEARMYQDQHGRFTAVDPLLASGKSSDPQTFNRYVYVLNCPLTFTDPNGLQAGRQQYGTQPPPTKITDIFITISLKERQKSGSQKDWYALAKSASGYQTVNVYTMDDGTATVGQFKSSLESEGRTVVVMGHAVADQDAVTKSTKTGSRVEGMGLSSRMAQFRAT